MSEADHDVLAKATKYYLDLFDGEPHDTANAVVRALELLHQRTEALEAKVEALEARPQVEWRSRTRSRFFSVEIRND